MLDWQVVVIAPLSPRAEIVPHVRIAGDLQREVRMRRAVAALAVGDYLGGRIEPERFELCAQLGGRFHDSVRIYRGRPILMIGTGNRAAMFRAHAFAEVFGIAANVEDLHLGAPDSFA